MNQRKALIGVSFLLSIIILCGCEKNQALEEPVTPKGGENSQNSYVLRSYTVTPEAVTVLFLKKVHSWEGVTEMVLGLFLLVL